MPREIPSFLTSSIELFKNLNIDFKNDDWGKETMIRKINVLSGEVLRTRKKVAEAESNVFKANTHNSVLKKEKEQLEEQMLSLKAKYHVVEEALAKTRNKVRSLSEKFAMKERELMSTKDELSRENAATEELRSNLEFTQKHLANGDNNLQRLETENSRLKSKINQLMRENAKHRTSVEISRKFEESIQLYERKLKNFKLSLEKEIVAREVRLSCAFEKLKQLARWTQKCGSELKKRVERECELKRRIVALESAAESQRQDSSATLTTQATIKNQMRKIKQLVQQKQELERKVQQSDLKISSLQMSSHYQINTIRESFEEGLKQFKAQCEKFRQDMEATRTELNKEKSTSSRLRSELELEKRDSRRLLERIENMGRLRQYFLSLQQADIPVGSQPITAGVGVGRSNHKEKKAECYTETHGSEEGTTAQQLNKNALYERLGHLIKKMEHNLA